MSNVADQIQTALAEDLPSGWSLASIEDLVGGDGVFVDGDWVESKDQDPTGDVRLIQLADIGDGVYRNKSDRFLTHEKAFELGCTFLRRDDVLIARMPDPLGRACIFPGDPKKSVTVVDVAIVRSGNGEFNHRWLMYFINAPVFRTVMASLQSGSTRKRISRGNLARITLPVPPREQQKRIVAEIEKQFSRLDEAVANLKRVKANLKRYKASVLKAAVEGKLTEDWRKQHPNVEPASKLLERILAGRRQKWGGKGKYKESPVPDTANLPTLPNTWRWSSVETICSDIVDCPHSTPKWEATGRACLRTTEFRPGRLVLSDVRFVSQSTYEKRIQRLKPRENDIVYSREGGILGVACMVPHGIDPCLGQRMMLLRSHALFTPNFLMHWLNSSWTLVRVRSLTGGSASPHLNVGEVKLFPVPLAPLAEQEQIVAEVERRLSIIEELEVAVQANLTRADRLRQSILQQAFSGKVPMRWMPDVSRKAAGIQRSVQ